MPFLLAAVFLAWANLIASFRSFSKEDLPGFFLHFGAVTPFVIATLLSVYLSPANEHGVAGDARNWVPFWFLIFGLCSVVIFSSKLRAMVKKGTDATVTGWRAGIAIVCVFSGLYLAGTTIDHYLFFRDNASSGIAAADFLDPKDGHCDGMILIRFNGDEAEYRCPKSISLGNMTSQPFVPWPSYDAGRSKELKARIDVMRENAVHSSKAN